MPPSFFVLEGRSYPNCVTHPASPTMAPWALLGSHHQSIICFMSASHSQDTSFPKKMKVILRASQHCLWKGSESLQPRRERHPGKNIPFPPSPTLTSNPAGSVHTGEDATVSAMWDGRSIRCQDLDMWHLHLTTCFHAKQARDMGSSVNTSLRQGVGCPSPSQSIRHAKQWKITL